MMTQQEMDQLLQQPLRAFMDTTTVASELPDEYVGQLIYTMKDINLQQAMSILAMAILHCVYLGTKNSKEIH